MATLTRLGLPVAQSGVHHTANMLCGEPAISVAALALRRRDHSFGGCPNPCLNKSINKALSEVPCQPSLRPTEELPSRCKQQKEKKADAFKCRDSMMSDVHTVTVFSFVFSMYK